MFQRFRACTYCPYAWWSGMAPASFTSMVLSECDDDTGDSLDAGDLGDIGDIGVDDVDPDVSRSLRVTALLTWK